MAKSQISYEKRRREVEKKRKAEEKRGRRKAKKVEGGEGERSSGRGFVG